MALRANPPMTFSLASAGVSLPLEIGTIVKIFNRPPNAGEPLATWFQNAPQLLRDTNFSLDPANGTVTITDSTLTDPLTPGSANALNTWEPLIIGTLNPATTIVDATTGAPMPAPPVAYPPLRNRDGIGPLDNLVWFMAIPQGDSFLPTLTKLQDPTSGPSIMGNTLYYCAGNSGIVAVDTRGNGTQHFVHITNPIYDSNANPGDNLDKLNNSDSNLRVHILPGTGGGGAMLEPPIGTERTLALNLPVGITALDARPTLISDNNRLLEVDYGGNALWTLDATIATLTAANGDSVTSRTNLARPSVAHRIGLDQFFIADTNNNRVTLANRGGATQWEMATFSNDLGFIAPNAPLTLNGPTDVEFHQDTFKTFTVYSKDGVALTYNSPCLVNRYLIADSGNFRLLEVLDVLDAQSGDPVKVNGITLSRQCSFVSRSLGEQNLRHRYRTIQEFNTFDNNGDPMDTYIVSAVANTARSTTEGASLNASGGNQEGLGGSIEILHRDFTKPANDGAIYAVFSSLKLPSKDKSAVTLVPLNNVTFCKGFYDPNPLLPTTQNYQYIIADGNGCYVVDSTGTILWRLTSDQYQAMTGRPLRASSIQRLAQADYDSTTKTWYHRYLITNRYEGPDAIGDLSGIKANKKNIEPGQIHGEVFEIKGINYDPTKGGYDGSGSLYLGGVNGTVLALNPDSPLTWLFPNERQVKYSIRGLNALITDKFGIERSVGSSEGATTTYLPQQPSFAERL